MILRELISKILTLSLSLFLSFSRGTLRAAVRFGGSTSSPPSSSSLLRIHLVAGDSSRVPDPDLSVLPVYALSGNLHELRRTSKVPSGRRQSAMSYKSIIRFVAAP